MMGLDAKFAAKLDKVIRRLEGQRVRVSVVSSYRTRSQQAYQYERFKRGEISRAARPGRSCHEVGAAADLVLVPPRYDLLGAFARDAGLVQPFPQDDAGHIEDTALCRELYGAVPARPQLPSARPAGGSRSRVSDPPLTPAGNCGCP